MNQALQDVIEHRRTTNVFEPNHTISDEIPVLLVAIGRAATDNLTTRKQTLADRSAQLCLNPDCQEST